MCGIAGLLTAAGGASDRLERLARAMTRSLAHRGPDDGGVWVDAAAGIAFGHRRLAIVDLSSQGHQPMVSDDGRYILTMNGEIYNFLVLANELESAGAAPRWRGHSDTEVLLAAISRWGLAETLERAVGMFAFALWDRAERALHLVRDRMGEKPLYYGLIGGELVFGSELKSLALHAEWSGEIDRAALGDYVRYAYVPAPRSIYRGIGKLPGGTRLRITAADVAARRIPEPVAYWSLERVAQAARTGPTDAHEATEELAALLRQSVAQQTIVDVPFGAFLSGGVDSSTVVAVMQSQIMKPVRTFSIGFSEVDYNEADYARGVARHLGTDHTQLYVSPHEAQSVITRLPAIFDEPFADSSQIPTYLVARMAKEHVTVSLSGDAGDELFAGYARYPEAIARFEALGRFPEPVRRWASLLASRIPLPVLDAALLNRASPWRHRVDIADRIRERALVNSSRSFAEYYHLLRCHFKTTASLVRGAGKRSTIPDDVSAWPAGMDRLQHMMFVDMCHYMPDDILVKVDRSAMAVSLETRVPLLDPDVVELAWSIPSATHRKDGRGKWVLRRILAQHVPTELIDRPKKGFSVPVARWLRSELRPWAEELLRRDRLEAEGLLDAGMIQRLWDQHLAGGTDWSYHLWNVLMFQAWLGQTSKDKAA